MIIPVAEQESVLIIGAGYAGLMAARSLTKRLRGKQRITLITEHPDFVERVRLHQLATGQRLARITVTEALPDTEVIIDSVIAIHRDERAVELAAGRRIGYHRLVYALGSGAGVRPSGTDSVSTVDAAVRLKDRLDGLDRGTVAVIGAGLTGLEAATELAETRPELSVTLVTDAELGDGLSAVAGRHLRKSLNRLDITVHERTRISDVDGDFIRGRNAADADVTLHADLIIWAAGFTPSPIAAAAGLAVDDHGRALVDRGLRSITDPRIWVIGDAAAATTVGGGTSRMSCQAAVPTAWYAVADLIGDINGFRRRQPLTRFVWQNISLGRRDGITQFSRGDDSPRPFVLTGRVSALFKELISYGVAWLVTGRRPVARSTRASRVARIPGPLRSSGS